MWIILRFFSLVLDTRYSATLNALGKGKEKKNIYIFLVGRQKFNFVFLQVGGGDRKKFVFTECFFAF